MSLFCIETGFLKNHKIMVMNNLVKISDLFDVRYGNSLELINLTQCKSTDKNSVPFVSRTEKNNGISAYVKEELDIEPNPAHTLSVAVGGSVLSTFYQPLPFYTGFHVLVLSPKNKMSVIEMLFYAKCIRANKYKYNYGRQANKTLKNLLIPAKIPNELKNHLLNYQKEQLKNISDKSLINKKIKLDISDWEYYNLTSLFDISASRDALINDLTLGGTSPYVTSSDSNNGVTSYVDEEPTNSEKTITANRGGSVGYFYYQPRPYLATPVDVRILTPKFSINTYIGLFLKTVLQLEKYRFNYSRKMGSGRLASLKIKLPTKNNKPDWKFMEDYIKSLQYSRHIL